MGAVIRPGIPRDALYRACDHDKPAMSQVVWDELVDVLHRPRLPRFIAPDQRASVLQLLRSVSVWFAPGQRVRECRDAKDDKYLELALAAEASIIVSSDDDLVVMHPWRGIQIMRPAAYLQGKSNEDHT